MVDEYGVLIPPALILIATLGVFIILAFAEWGLWWPVKLLIRIVYRLSLRLPPR